MKNKLNLILLGVLVALCVVGCSKKDNRKTDTTPKEKSSEGILTEDNIDNLLKGKHYATIEIIDFGTIEVELDADSAPVSVTNFVNLAESKFYDGLTFHRIVENFVIQGGDPNGDGTGGAENCIKGEFIDNGVDNKLEHKKGTLSMARAMNYDSASSQFFICHKDAPSLNGQYAAFGKVIKGMKVVDAIVDNVPTVNEQVAPENQPVIKTITIKK
jgi:peptidyl-prolyl cis-trans isomerase B (cyclophilin B)